MFCSSSVKTVQILMMLVQIKFVFSLFQSVAHAKVTFLTNSLQRFWKAKPCRAWAEGRIADKLDILPKQHWEACVQVWDHFQHTNHLTSFDNSYVFLVFTMGASKQPDDGYKRTSLEDGFQSQTWQNWHVYAHKKMALWILWNLEQHRDVVH